MRIKLEKLEADIGRAIALSKTDRRKNSARINRIDAA
jgi:hypothetical protein